MSDGRLDLHILPGYVFSFEVLLRVLTQNLEPHVDGILEVFPRPFACAALGDGTSLTCKQSPGNNHSLALTPAPPDTAAPITTASATEGGNTYPPGTWTNQNVTLYSSSVQPHKVVFTKGWAASKSRTLEIRVSGTKNAASSGERVDVDAFVVLR